MVALAEPTGRAANTCCSSVVLRFFRAPRQNSGETKTRLGTTCRSGRPTSGRERVLEGRAGANKCRLRARLAVWPARGAHSSRGLPANERNFGSFKLGPSKSRLASARPVGGGEGSGRNKCLNLARRWPDRDSGSRQAQGERSIRRSTGCSSCPPPGAPFNTATTTLVARPAGDSGPPVGARERAIGGSATGGPVNNGPAFGFCSICLRLLFAAPAGCCDAVGRRTKNH